MKRRSVASMFLIKLLMFCPHQIAYGNREWGGEKHFKTKNPKSKFRFDQMWKIMWPCFNAITFLPSISVFLTYLAYFLLFFIVPSLFLFLSLLFRASLSLCNTLIICPSFTYLWTPTPICWADATQQLLQIELICAACRYALFRSRRSERLHEPQAL